MSCRDCKDNNLARGLGDTLANVIDKFTNVKPCEGCKERQDKLNKWMPYSTNAKRKP